MSTVPVAVPARPIGISIIAILSAIVGILFVLGGLAHITAGAAVGLLARVPGVGILAVLGILGGFIMLAWGAFEVYVAYGAWNLQRWTWTVLLVLAILGLIHGLFSFRTHLLNVIINAVVIYYLYTPTVKAAFGRA